MMSVRSILLLLALIDAVAGLFQRIYHENDHELSWSDAQAYCKNKYVDLSIIDTKNEIAKSVRDSFEKHWIGLRKNPGDSNFKQWTDGRALGATHWDDHKPDPNNNKDCAFTQNGKWSNEECTETLKSFCYSWEPQMIVVQEEKTWEEALVHCRKFYTDLVSLTSETDLFLVKNTSSDILTPTFWTSLHFMDGSWFWVNWRYSKWQTSFPSCPARPFLCGARNIVKGVWENRDCKEKMNFICYNENVMEATASAFSTK